MNSTSGASPAECSARIRSAAKMKLPLRTAMASNWPCAVAVISLASAALRAAIVPASNRTRIFVSADNGNPHDPNSLCGRFLRGKGLRAKFLRAKPQPGVAPAEEADDYITSIGRRRGEAGAERQPVARPERGLRRQRRPG